MPRITDDPYGKIADSLMPFARTESNEPCRHFVGHIARQFERVALGAAYDSAVGAEQCCYNVYDSRLDDFRSRMAQSNPRCSKS